MPFKRVRALAGISKRSFLHIGCTLAIQSMTRTQHALLALTAASCIGSLVLSGLAYAAARALFDLQPKALPAGCVLVYTPALVADKPILVPGTLCKKTPGIAS